MSRIKIFFSFFLFLCDAMAGSGSNKNTLNSKWLRINSAQRITGPDSTDSDFVIDLGNNIQKVHRISIHSVQFPNVFYNVFETKQKFNNYIKLVVNNGSSQLFGTHFIRIPPGYYSAYSLYTAIATAFGTELAADFSGEYISMTFTMDTTTNKLSVSMYEGTTPLGSSGGSISTPTAEDLKSTTGWPDGIPSGRVDYWPFGLLGFESIDLVNLPSNPLNAITYSATYMPSLINPSVAYITSSTLSPSNSYDEKGNMSNVLLPVNINVPFGNLVIFDCKQDVLCELNYKRPRALDRVDIQLVDHDLDPLDLSQCELNLDLRIWFNT